MISRYMVNYFIISFSTFMLLKLWFLGWQVAFIEGFMYKIYERILKKNEILENYFHLSILGAIAIPTSP